MTDQDHDKIQRRLDGVREQLAVAQKGLGEKNVALSKLRRQLDSVPGNAELNQYQRRFTELCTQGASYFFLFSPFSFAVFFSLIQISISFCQSTKNRRN